MFNWNNSISTYKYNTIFTVPLLIYPYIVFNWKPAKKYNCNKLLLFWNLFQTIFSITTFINLAIPSIDIYNNHGFNAVVCQNVDSVKYTQNDYGIWIYYFYISKIWDLIDTLFIILKQKPVSFIHWYHHEMTLLVAYIGFNELNNNAVWSALINTFVHSNMYLYYSISHYYKMNGNILITALQVLQMFIAIYLIIHSTIICNQRFDYIALTLYSIYSCVFYNYFKVRYLLVKND